MDLISNNSKEIIQFSQLMSNKLNKEFNNISRNTKYWFFKSKNSKFITYFRFIKFYEYLIKRLATKVGSVTDNNQIEFVKAINMLQTNGLLKLHEYNIINKQRKFRNVFIHDLGMNYSTRDMKVDINRSLYNLNAILSRLLLT
ncbi:MAG: hypothetical protein GPJ54_10290 [Candidatus Heimdallarchaeota archaeon]|nr:hypothetical protein [Candidatus Heimdallarchaeota archaeon]